MVRTRGIEMRPEEIRTLVETATRGFKAGEVGANALSAKRDGEKALIDLTVMVLIDIHRIANALSDPVLEVIPGEYPA